jgi:hypothetical protein
MKHKKKVISIALALLAAIGWAMLPPAEDPQVAKVRELQQKLFAEPPGSDSKVPFEQRREAFGELRREMEKLAPEERDKLMRENPPPFVRRFQKDISDFFELPPEKRKEALDRHIDTMEKMRRDMQQRFAKQGGPPEGGFPRGGPGPRGGMDPGRRAGFAKRMLDNTTPESRAQMNEFMRQMQDRRRERGMPALPGPRF